MIPPLGHCVPCLEASVIQGGTNQAHVPASCLVNGTGMCSTCAAHALSPAVGAAVYAALKMAPRPQQPGPGPDPQTPPGKSAGGPPQPGH